MRLPADPTIPDIVRVLRDHEKRMDNIQGIATAPQLRGTMDANGQRIVNVADAVNDRDAINKKRGAEIYGPKDARYVVTQSDGTLTNERVLTAGSGISVTVGASTVTVAATGSGTGDVVGPASATSNAFALFDGTTGKLLKDSAVDATFTGTGNVVRATSPTLTTPTMSSPTISDRIVKVAGGDIVVPNVAGTFCLIGASQALTDKTLNDNSVSFVDNGDATKVLKFECSGISTATTRTLTVPDASGTIALTADLASYQPLDSDLTSWAAVTRAAGFDTFAATPSSANLAALLSDETGTGAAVFANTPTLVTPVLGTPTSGTLTNCTGLPISTGVSGLGTGVATFLATPSSANLRSLLTDETGSGALVFATSPTLVTPNIGAATGTSLDLASGGGAVILANGSKLHFGGSTGSGWSLRQTVSGLTVRAEGFGDYLNVNGTAMTTGLAKLNLGDATNYFGQAFLQQGGASDSIRVGGTVHRNVTSAASTSSSYTTLMSHSLASSTMSTNGDRLSIKVRVTNLTSGATTAQWRLIVGSTTVFTSTDTATNGEYLLEMEVYRTGTSSSTGSYRVFSTVFGLQVGDGSVAPTTSWSSAQTISIEGKDSAAAGELIVQYLDISWHPNNS